MQEKGTLMDVIELTRKLLSFNTINPPGNEAGIARFTGDLLSGHGFEVHYHEFGESRLHMVAERGIKEGTSPIVLSGHFDTVPLGRREWSMDPFTGTVSNGKIWGRGSSDMKGALAAMILAAIESFAPGDPAGGVRLIFTAGEELGCQGISKMAAENAIPGSAGAIIIGEPTGNIPATAHKGAIYMDAVAEGRTAHSSMPELGDNAIYKAAAAILRIRDTELGVAYDPLLGYPTINIGKINGGMNINSVPDHAAFTIDVRTTPGTDHEEAFRILSRSAGDQVRLGRFVDLRPVYTPVDDPFVKTVYEVCGVDLSSGDFPKALPYLTDGAVLQQVYRAPVVILGPGEQQQAHQTDEYCSIEALQRSVEIYRRIILSRVKEG